VREHKILAVCVYNIIDDFIKMDLLHLSGIVAKNEHQSCVTPVSEIDQNPFDGYDHMAPGCQLSTGKYGLGVIDGAHSA
jgi:hypothetical protein